MRAAANKIQQRVVVVGGGLAGQSAAIQAARLGAKVLLLEKEGRLGGNSAKATSGINGWGTEAQRLAGVEDDAQHFERDTFLSGRGGNCDAGLVRMLSMKSAEAVQWLSDLGVPLTVLSQLGGASRKRCHRAPDKADGTPQPIGFIMVKTLEDHLRTQLQEHVTIETNARLLRLHKVVEVQASGQHLTRVSGVTYIKEGGEEGPATMDVEADAVILATGGFSNDHTATSLLEEYAPHLSSFPTTNGPWATGDGVKIARELGVHLVDMDKVQLHPTGLLNPQNPLSKTVFLGPEALRGSGGILLNKNGERFINELDLRSVVSQAIIAQDNEYPNSTGRKFAHCVLNDQAADLFGRGALGFYWKKLGLFQSAESVEELAQLIGCDEATLRQTLVEYEKLSSTKSSTCPTTGKNVFPCVVGPQGPFYVAYVTPSIHYTMGGCLISPSAEIQSAVDQPLTGRRPILGLFGAGEVTGGVHGGNRLGGNSLLECVVFGKIAGGRAAHGTSIGEAALPDDEEAIALTVQEVLPEGPPETSRSFNGSQLVLALPSSFQTSGLRLLEQVTIRAGGHSSVVMPSSPPSQLGSLSIYLPPLTDLPEGSTDGWLYDLHAGAEVTVSRVRSSHGDASMRLTQALSESKHMYLIAHAPDGVASMLQLLRAALEEPLRSQLTRLHLIYAATDPQQLTYQRVVEHCGEGQVDGFFRCTLALSNPSLKWEHEIGITPETIRRALGSHRGSSEEATIVVASSAERKEEIIFALSENGLMTKNVIFVEA